MSDNNDFDKVTEDILKQQESREEAIAVSIMAISSILIAKGIVTKEEFNEYAEASRAIVEKEKEAQLKKLREALGPLSDLFFK